MSVINKMLRDLDSRQTAGSTPVQAQDLRADLAQGTLIVNDSVPVSIPAKTSPGGLRVLSLMAITVAALAVMAGAGWYLNRDNLPAARLEQAALVPAPAVGSTVVAVAPTTALAPEHKASEAVSSAPDAVASASEPPSLAVKATPLAPPVEVKVPAVALRAAPAYMSLKMESNFQRPTTTDTASAPLVAGTPRPAAARPVFAAPTTPVPTSTSSLAGPATAPMVEQNQSRQSPTQEALAQAQSLWRAGSHDAAITLLHDALLVAERANLAGMSTGSTAVLASLARELARMELAEGRVSQALEMLTRLEPALAEVADIWAIRANAAQRLGRHRESVAAYLMALKLRPNEPRWMLGAAVSLAAQGHIEGAAEQAEKARASGALSPEVATYLRQLGVPLRER